MNDAITLVGDVLIALCALEASACVVAYQWTTGGAWRSTPTGRHLMAFMGAMAAITLLGTAKAFAVDLLDQPDPLWFQWARVVTLGLEPIVLAARLLIIIRAYLDANPVPVAIPKESLMQSSTLPSGAPAVPASIIRTVVPGIVGWALSKPIVNALGLTNDVLIGAVTAIVTALWYILWRLFEAYVSPRFGWLLGLAVAPNYAPHEGRHELGADEGVAP